MLVSDISNIASGGRIMDLVLGVVGLGALCAAVTLSFRVRQRLAATAPIPEDEYWLTVRRAEIMTRSGAPFV